jgi:hypothetical protein
VGFIFVSKSPYISQKERSECCLKLRHLVFEEFNGNVRVEVVTTSGYKDESSIIGIDSIHKALLDETNNQVEEALGILLGYIKDSLYATQKRQRGVNEKSIDGILSGMANQVGYKLAPVLESEPMVRPPIILIFDISNNELTTRIQCIRTAILNKLTGDDLVDALKRVDALKNDMYKGKKYIGIYPSDRTHESFLDKPLPHKSEGEQTPKLWIDPELYNSNLKEGWERRQQWPMFLNDFKFSDFETRHEQMQGIGMKFRATVFNNPGT